MPSFLDTDQEKEKPDWVVEEDIIGNDQADRLANIGAAHGDLNLHVSKPVIRYAYIAKQIQARFATIICNLPNRTKTKHNISIGPHKNST